jgi:hypothetical protein
VPTVITKKVLDANRIRRIDGGFSFIPHRFLTEGFLDSLDQKEILLYLFLVLASDRYGLSFYSYDVICSLLQLSADDYIEARNGLVKKDLIACDGTIFQVLELPESPMENSPMGSYLESDRVERRSRIAALIQQSLWEAEGGR